MIFILTSRNPLVNKTDLQALVRPTLARLVKEPQEMTIYQWYHMCPE